VKAKPKLNRNAAATTSNKLTPCDEGLVKLARILIARDLVGGRGPLKYVDVIGRVLYTELRDGRRFRVRPAKRT
jgi:hypothetical protein